MEVDDQDGEETWLQPHAPKNNGKFLKVIVRKEEK